MGERIERLVEGFGMGSLMIICSIVQLFSPAAEDWIIETLGLDTEEGE